MRLLSEDNGFSLNSALVGIMVVGAVLFASLSARADADPVQVLFVANGWYQQEDDILDHLNDLGCYDVTTKKDYQIYGSTDLSPYDLIIITEFAPGIGYYGLQNIENSGKPILIVEYWDFWYSYKLGLVEDDWAGYYGTDTVEVIDNEHPITYFFGDTIQVYDPSYTIYGIPFYDIADGVTPLIYSSSSFNEVAVLSDNDRKITATGIYDTTRYTVRGWMLFDYLLNALYQITPVREDPLSVWDDLIASELLVFLGQVEENPSGWTEDEVLREVWKKMVKWDLFSLSDQINLWVKEIFPELVVIPGIIPVPCNHPAREGFSQDKWFLGFHGDSHTSCWTSDYISGVDLGISTEFLGRLVFYMGDTWGANFECIDQTSFYDKGSLRHCFSVDAGPAGEVCNDAVVESIDQDPSDGVDVGLFIDYHKGRYGYSPLTMLLLHDDPEMWYNDYAFSVPTGAATIYTDKYYPPNPPISAQPTIVVWYGRGIRTHNPVSWVGCSSDKLRFWNCYWGVGPFVSFSEADGDPGVCDETGSGKFINVSPVPIGSSDFETICTDDPSSYLCDEKEIDRSGGLLLFGTGPGCDSRWEEWYNKNHPLFVQNYRLGPLYLAYIAHDDFGETNQNGTPKVKYFTGSGWADNEESANPIIYNSSNPLKYPKTNKNKFGEISVKIIREGLESGDVPYLVMLSNHVLVPPFYDDIDPENIVPIEERRVQYRIALLSEPWSWSEPAATNAEGYGPYIMDKYTSYNESEGNLILWHTLSSWKGERCKNYGVYTTKTEIPWPPK